MTALAPLVRTGDAIVETAKARYTTKSYDASLRIPEADLQGVRDLLRFSPSSTNASWQPMGIGRVPASVDIPRVRATTSRLGYISIYGGP